MRVKEGYYIEFWVDFVDADVPLLLGLDIIDRFRLMDENVDNTLVSKVDGWSIPIVRT